MGHVDNAGTVTNANTTTRTTKAVKSLPMPKVWAFAVGQFGWALLSGIISNWLVYFYQPDNETISQGQTVFVPQGLAVLGVVTGVIIFTVINYGLTYIGVNPYWQYIIKGAIIIFAVALDSLKYARKK